MAEDTGSATGQSEGTTGDGGDGGDESQLGDAGQKALDAWKSRAKTAEAKAKEADQLAAKLAKYEEASKTEHEKALEKARTEASAQTKSEVMKVANERIVKAAVREQAAGKLTNPADAAAFLDLGEFSVTDAGDVDEKQIASAIDRLLKERPYLAGDARRQTGSADQGARGSAATGTDMNALIRQRAGIS